MTTPASTPPPDLRDEMRRAFASLGAPPAGTASGATSDLSIDESLLLHAAGWEPVDLVAGVSVAAVGWGSWNWGTGHIAAAEQAWDTAMTNAAQRLARETSRVGGAGAVGVDLEVTIEPRHIEATLVGTAVRPTGDAAQARGSKQQVASDVFASDLSARDFVLLLRAGWRPLGLAFGASFVYAPRRGAGTALKQSNQNVELTNFTAAMYAARETAMERTQRSALARQAQGIVQVQVTEGPMPFASHAIGFSAWGTAVRLDAGAHQYVEPEVVLPLDDAVLAFDAASLRGAAPA